jgi:hypothetical protein
MSLVTSPVTGKPYGLARSAASGGSPVPAFIATGPRRPIRHRDGAGRWARCPTMT